jgi:serine/threonine-protein kinase HipA
MPEDKYGKDQGLTYLSVATVLLSIPELGEPAVHELLRRLVVNEMLGNPDMHLKNLGLRYPDGHTAEFSPAYDVVAYACYQGVHGHALRLVPERKDAPWTQGQQQLSPALLRDFCEQLDIVERPAAAVVRDTVARAVQSWPELIEQSALSKTQKQRLSAHFETHPLVQSLRRRTNTSKARPSGSSR